MHRPETASRLLRVAPLIGDGALPASGVAPRPPNRGLVAWTFPVRDLGEVERRAKAAGTPIVAGPIDYRSPTLGRHRALTVLAPNGFLVELVEPHDEDDGIRLDRQPSHRVGSGRLTDRSL